MEFEKFRKEHKLTINSNGKIYIKPLDRHNFISFPLNDLSGCVEVSFKEYIDLAFRKYRFTEDLTAIEENK